MAKEPPYQNKKDEDASNIKGKYGIGDNLIDIDLGAGVIAKGDKRATGIYKNLGSIRSTRTGYTILSCLDYVTQCPQAVFYLPFPDSIFVPAETNWSENSEDGLSAAIGMASENGGQQRSNLDAALGAGGQAMAKKLADFAPAKAALRTAGLAYNPNNQMYFNGVNFSGGTFTFKLVPKSAGEAAVMYTSAKAILKLSLPGAAANDVIDVLKRMIGMVQSLFTPGGNDESAKDAAERERKAQEDLKRMSAEINEKISGNHKIIDRFQPAFFSYPPLWDISFHIPTNERDKPVFEWRRLALENVRLDLGSGDLKWHSDGLPVSVNMTLQVKETILKYAGNIDDVMPVIIV